MSDAVDAAVEELERRAMQRGAGWTDERTTELLESAKNRVRALLTPTITGDMVTRGAETLYDSLDGMRGRMHFTDEDAMDEACDIARLVLEAAARQRATGSGVTGGPE